MPSPISPFINFEREIFRILYSALRRIGLQWTGAVVGGENQTWSWRRPYRSSPKCGRGRMMRLCWVERIEARIYAEGIGKARGCILIEGRDV